MYKPRQLVLRLRDGGPSSLWEQRLRLAQDPQAPLSELEKVLLEPMWTRLALAGNQAAPVDPLRRLADDPSPAVRRRVARRSDLPDRILERLASDSEEMVREAAIRTLRKSPTA